MRSVRHCVLRARILLTAIALCFVSAHGLAVEIANTLDLQNSTTISGSDRTFNANNSYRIRDGQSVTDSSTTNYSMGDNTSLVVENGACLSLNGGFSVVDNSAVIGSSGTLGSIMVVFGPVVQYGGTMVVSAGDNSYAHGFSAKGAGSGFTQKGGSLTANGGGGGDAVGLLVHDTFTQDGGDIVANGGPGRAAFGIRVDNGLFTQNGGTLTLQGGDGDFSQGMLVYDSAIFNGDVVIAPGKGTNAHSLVVESLRGSGRPSIVFGSGSTLTVAIVDERSGSILVGGNRVEIQPGATLTVTGTNTLTSGSRSFEFLTFAYGGDIDGTFATPDSQTLGFTAYKSADNSSYFIEVTRIDPIVNVVSANSNGARAMAAIEAAGALPSGISAAYDYLDNNSANPNLPLWAGGGLTPQQNTQVFSGLRRLNDAVTATALSNMETFSLALASRQASADWSGARGYASLDSACGAYGNTLWAAPFYLRGSQDGKTAEFADLDDKYAGVGLGYIRAIDRTDFGLSFHYARGDYDASDYDSKSDTYGVTLAARHRFVGTSGFAPEVAAWAGYSYTDLDQNRLAAPNPSRRWLASDPNINQWYAGASVGNLFRVNDCFGLKPWIGLDYSHQRQGSYRETGGGGLELAVDSGTYNSLLGSLGLEADFALTSRACLKAFGVYQYEFLDAEATLRSAFIADPAIVFDAKSQDLSRHQGRVGAEFKYAFTDRVAASAGYALALGDHYVGHHFGVGLSVSW